ncbi:MAG: hypothetical protein Crog4KO_14170 [Crocinitomicaceae bacterium]
MKFLQLSAIFLLIFATGCASLKSNKELPGSGTIDVKKEAKSEKYGYSQSEPINVGGVSDGNGPGMERKFLNQLAGPNGEEITYDRVSSCCAFDTPHGLLGQGLLDVYEVTWEGLTAPKKLYINMYDYEEPMIPVGFTRK